MCGFCCPLVCRYTRNLDTAKNTHLVAKKAEGPKYEAAKADAGEGGIQVVRPAWLDECYQCKEWIPVRPQDHLFSDGPKDGNNLESEDIPGRGCVADETGATDMAHQSLPRLEEQLERVFQSHPVDIERHTLFLPCHFILLSFDHDGEITDDQVLWKNGQLLCQLIRGGMGRIAWTFNYHITHVVIPDGCCNESVRYVLPHHSSCW